MYYTFIKCFLYIYIYIRMSEVFCTLLYKLLLKTLPYNNGSNMKKILIHTGEVVKLFKNKENKDGSNMKKILIHTGEVVKLFKNKENKDGSNMKKILIHTGEVVKLLKTKKTKKVDYQYLYSIFIIDNYFDHYQ